jgi:hypothetical protein
MISAQAPKGQQHRQHQRQWSRLHPRLRNKKRNPSQQVKKARPTKVREALKDPSRDRKAGVEHNREEKRGQNFLQYVAVKSARHRCGTLPHPTTHQSPLRDASASPQGHRQGCPKALNVER